MIPNVQVYSILGVSKKEYNIPPNWTFSCFFTSKGKLFTVNATSLFGDFITEEELKAKVQQYYRKEKLYQISNVQN